MVPFFWKPSSVRQIWSQIEKCDFLKTEFATRKCVSTLLNHSSFFFVLFRLSEIYSGYFGAAIFGTRLPRGDGKTIACVGLQQRWLMPRRGAPAAVQLGCTGITMISCLRTMSSTMRLLITVDNNRSIDRTLLTYMHMPIFRLFLTRCHACSCQLQEGKPRQISGTGNEERRFVSCCHGQYIIGPSFVHHG